MAAPPDADRYLDMKLHLLCPTCGSAGLIPWEHLDRVLYCRGCERLFRVEASGMVELEPSPQERISVQVRSSSSQWQQHRAVIEKEATVPERLRAWAMNITLGRPFRWAAAVLAAGLVVGGYALTTREPPQPQPAPLPTSLDERALLLAEAVARRDMEVLIGLTDPAEHRALRTWLAHGADVPSQQFGQSETIETALLSRIPADVPGENVQVRVRLRFSADNESAVLEQQWVRRADTWYFRPVRLRVSRQPIAWPQQKRRPERR